MSRRYVLVCTAIGLALSWMPAFVHGPIREKWDYYFLNGGWAIWNWYLARGLIGFMVGISSWPQRWWLRGPLVGFLMLLPPATMSMANPLCGPPCVAGNESTGMALGLLVGGIAFLITRRHHALDEPPAG